MSDYIPPELMPNILARLPADDVLRCTSVCKSWYKLITSSSFGSLHFNLSNQEPEPRLLVRDEKDVNGVSSYYYRLYRDNQMFDEIAELDYPCSDTKQWRVIDCINGLLCLFNARKGTIMLWNPSIRKSFVLPESRVLFDSVQYYKYLVGFGFVAASNEYMIVKFSGNKAEIYKVNNGSWYNLDLEDPAYLFRKPDQAHLNGILHWSSSILRDYDHLYFTSSSDLICSFDMKNGKFNDLMIPSCVRDLGNLFLPSIFRESLSLLNYNRDLSCTIWVMKEYGVADSWEKLFTIDNKEILTSYPKLRHNGEILFAKADYDTGKTELVSYDYANNQVKNLVDLANATQFGILFNAHSYLNSLVLIKGSNEVKVNENPTKIPLECTRFAAEVNV